MIGTSRSRHALDPVAHRSFDQADVADQAFDAVGLQRGGLVGAPHGAVQSDVPFDDAGPEATAATEEGMPVSCPEYPTGTPNCCLSTGMTRDSVPRNKPDRCCWSAGGSDSACRSTSHGVVDLIEVAHSGGQRLPAGPWNGCGLRARRRSGRLKPPCGMRVILLDEIDRGFVPRGYAPDDPLFAAVGVDLAILLAPNSRPRFRSPLVGPKGFSRGRANSSFV